MEKKASDKLLKAIEAATIKLESPADLDLPQLAEILNEYSFAIVEGMISRETVKAAKEKIREQFDPSKDRPATGEHPSEIMDNFQKLSIGGAEHSGVYRPRCMRTFYNPIWSEDRFGLRESFRKIAQLRNLMYGFDIDHAVDEVDDGFWTAARIHHYPAGGGFLVSHLDDVVPQVQKAEGISTYFQPVLMMSERGDGPDCDFTTGGGFFEYDGERFYYESHCEMGNVVIYSGATIHGVEDIDLHKAFDSHSPKGRLAGFVTLYRHFERKGQLGDYIPGAGGKSDS